MKNKFLLNIIGALLAVSFLFVSCQKEDQVTLPTQMNTWDVSDITSTSAIVRGIVVAEGDGIAEYGIYWGKTEKASTTGTQLVIKDVEKSVFKTELAGLDHLTKYYYVAYIKTTGGDVKMGEEMSFSTLANLATVTSAAEASAITSFTATLAVEVPYDGMSPIKEKGLCYSTENDMPTIEDMKATAGEGEGNFNGTLTNLRSATKYYVRAFATNGVGTTYGTMVEFSTLDSAPYVEIASVVGGGTDGTVTARITYSGGQDVTEFGIIWSNDNQIDIDTDNVVKVTESTTEDGIVTYEHKITGLASNSTYHVAAYAKNSVGTGISSSSELRTFPPELYMTGSGVGTDAEDWNWNGSLQFVPVHSHPELFWKIVWMKGAGEFKIAPQAAWTGGDFGKTGDAVDGVYQRGGDNIPVPTEAGYYMVVVDLAKGTIEITEPKVYGMGGSFGGWDAAKPENLFTVDNANEVIKFEGVPATDNLRMHVAASTLACDWWRAEFSIIGGKIEFRGTGDDQAAVPVTANDIISLNFKAGTGTITTP